MEKEPEEKRIFLSQAEKTYYASLFTKYTEKEAGSGVLVVTSSTVKGLFIRSKLSSEDLAKIWNYTVEKSKKNMDKATFYRALKLIAIVQSKKTFNNWEEECQKGIECNLI